MTLGSRLIPKVQFVLLSAGVLGMFERRLMKDCSTAAMKMEMTANTCKSDLFTGKEKSGQAVFFQ